MISLQYYLVINSFIDINKLRKNEKGNPELDLEPSLKENLKNNTRSRVTIMLFPCYAVCCFSVYL